MNGDGVNLFNIFSVVCGDYCCCLLLRLFVPIFIRNSRDLQQTFYFVIVCPSLFVYLLA